MWKDEHYFMVYTITDEDVLRSSVVVVKKIIQRVVKQLMSYYPNLEAFPKSHSYCTSSVEVVLFADLYEQIFSMYKFHYKREDSMYTKQIQEFSSITPAHFGVPERLWLLNVSDYSSTMLCRSSLSPERIRVLHFKCRTKRLLMLSKESENVRPPLTRPNAW